MGVGMLAILMVLLIPIIAIVGGLALAALRILKGGQRGKSRQQAEEETGMIQAIYQELSRMEERIEALETLLVEQEMQGRKKDETSS